MSLKILLVVLLLYMGLKMAKKALKNWVFKLLGGAGPKKRENLELQPCAHCGLQVATDLAVRHNGESYCSSDCAKKGPSQGPQ